MPLALPAAAGCQLTVRLRLCPLAICAGRLSAPRVKPVPETDACETVAVDPPVFVRVTVCDCLLPTVTLPKPTVAGAAVNVGSVRPVPARSTTAVIPVVVAAAVLVRERRRLPKDPNLLAAAATSPLKVSCPLTAPALAGAKRTLICKVWLGESVRGTAGGATRLKPVPVIEICERVTLVVPMFCTVTGRDFVLPIFKLPKVRLAGAVSWVLGVASPERVMVEPA